MVWEAVVRGYARTRQLCALMSAIPLLLWVTHKQTVIKVSHDALAP